MKFLIDLAPILAGAVAVIIIISILLQRSGSGVGSGLGNDSYGTINYTRRGFEKFLFYLTIILSIIFLALVLIPTILK
jgi:protein translocase SecG subunit